MFQYMAIGVVLLMLGAALAAALWRIESLNEKIGALEIRYEQQRHETEKANLEIASVKAQHTLQIATMTSLQEESSRENTRLRRKTRDIEATTGTLHDALIREPVRTGRAATYLDRRGMREICRASGGSIAACKIAIPKPNAAGPGNTGAAPDRADKILGSKQRGDGGSDVHDKPRLDRNPDLP